MSTRGEQGGWGGLGREERGGGEQPRPWGGTGGRDLSRSELETPILYIAGALRTPCQETHPPHQDPCHRHQGEEYPREMSGGRGLEGTDMGNMPRDTAKRAGNSRPVQGNPRTLPGHRR